MKKIVALLCVIAFSVFAQESPLATKLVEGSPWRFTTRYENTVHEFRLTPEGKLQRMSSGNPGIWVDVSITGRDTIEYTTMNGHVITFYVAHDGSAAAKHSKHTSDFRSEKK